MLQGTERNTKFQMFLNHPIVSISKCVNPPSRAEGGVLRSFTRKYESFSLPPVQLMTSHVRLYIFSTSQRMWKTTLQFEVSSPFWKTLKKTLDTHFFPNLFSFTCPHGTFPLFDYCCCCHSCQVKEMRNAKEIQVRHCLDQDWKLFQVAMSTGDEQIQLNFLTCLTIFITLWFYT